jgi:hypothetical protein
MPTVVTRASKGSALTWAEGDANINNLNTAIDNIVSGTQAVGLATNADNIDIATTNGNSSDTAMSVVLVANQATGNQAPHIDAGLTYNASTNALTATTFVGALTGNADTATTATGATSINISTINGNSSDTSMSVVLVGAISTGNQLPHIDGGLTYNASTNTLTASAFSGSGAGLTSIPNSALTNSSITINGTAISLGGSVTTPSGTVTSVGGTGTVNGLTLTGSVTSTGNLTLGGTLDLSAPPAIGGTTANTGRFSGLTLTGNIVSESNGNITVTPNGTGRVVIDGLTYPKIDGTNGQVLTTNGSGGLSFTTVSGGSGSSNLDGLTDVTITGTPSLGQILRYTANNVWENQAPGFLNAVQGDSAPNLGGNLNVNGNQIVSASNGNISIQPNGTGQTLIKNLEYNENVFSLGTTSGTITPDAANGNVQTITLNGNLTFSAFANPISGQTITLIITTGGTGRTLTSTMLFAGGSKTLSTTSTVDILTVSYIGTTYYASLVKDYK